MLADFEVFHWLWRSLVFTILSVLVTTFILWRFLSFNLGQVPKLSTCTISPFWYPSVMVPDRPVQPQKVELETLQSVNCRKNRHFFCCLKQSLIVFRTKESLGDLWSRLDNIGFSVLLCFSSLSMKNPLSLNLMKCCI